MPQPLDILRYWGLKRHPFNPQIASAKYKIDLDVFANSIDPKVDPQLVNFLHDIYEWDDPPRLHREALSGDAPLLPQPQELPDPASRTLLVLVTGVPLTGRRSVLNFVRYQFELERGGAPLVLNFKLGNGDGATNARAAASQFRFQYGKGKPQEVQEQLKEIVSEATPENAGNVAPFYPAVFNNLRSTVEPEDQPIIILLDDVSHYNLWVDMYLTFKSYCDLVLVLAKDEQEATRCKEAMDVRQENSALIRSPKLNQDAARAYLRERLRRERDADPPTDTLWPFLDESLEEIYRPAQPGGSTEIAWPVQFLNRTFRTAVDKKLEALGDQGNGVEAAMAADSEAGAIGVVQIRAARKVINLGG